MAIIRLNKFLSESGRFPSRRKSEEYILQGRIEVNGEVVTELAYKVDTEKDIVTFDGEKVTLEKPVYFLLHKPKGYICSTVKQDDKIPVTQLIKTNKKIYPIGRLDINTTGVLLLTNDGDFANFLTHPKNNIERVYIAKLSRDLTDEVKEKLEKGITLDKRKSKFEEIKFIKRNNRKLVEITCTEGRNHFVKRMFQSFGIFVEQLHRKSFAGFTADFLKPGEYIEISEKEVQDIWNFLKKIKKKKNTNNVPKFK
ncbi:MAG TPA: pseudouridine synthase [Ignavibacteriales bacterium]|nr:pseudouridine synthase [Ignavibacteriales bacterium]HOL80619.1 pseudouridine synthase [Ignavibacteriales bacterium]HOM64307.1 pseudouridine synthase [Ignavibacteriales bacterium]HPD68033.1 pseudouridine synthase [Ignavibacteriales bacterium]HPP33047.1 pseudouridine synthase [Ignavibacteriales bacterium]